MDTFKKKKRTFPFAKDEDGTDIKVKRHNLIVARASFPGEYCAPWPYAGRNIR